VYWTFFPIITEHRLKVYHGRREEYRRIHLSSQSGQIKKKASHRFFFSIFCISNDNKISKINFQQWYEKNPLINKKKCFYNFVNYLEKKLLQKNYTHPINC